MKDKHMKYTCAVKANGKWTVFTCIANDDSEMLAIAKRKFKNVAKVKVVFLEAEEPLTIDV